MRNNQNHTTHSVNFNGSSWLRELSLLINCPQLLLCPAPPFMHWFCFLSLKDISLTGSSLTPTLVIFSLSFTPILTNQTNKNNSLPCLPVSSTYCSISLFCCKKHPHKNSLYLIASVSLHWENSFQANCHLYIPWKQPLLRTLKLTFTPINPKSTVSHHFT